MIFSRGLYIISQGVYIFPGVYLFAQLPFFIFAQLNFFTGIIFSERSNRHLRFNSRGFMNQTIILSRTLIF